MKKLLLLVGLTVALTLTAAAGVHEVQVKDMDGKEVALKDYQGKVLLVVNVASRCGYTKQYAGLEALYQKYKDRGLVVMGFPCNQFGGQEPGTNDEIREFCRSKFNVTFPLFDKIEVNGPNRHPLYVQLAGKESPFPGDIRWNFNKFLVNRQGKVVQRFDSKAAPDAAELVAAVEAALDVK